MSSAMLEPRVVPVQLQAGAPEGVVLSVRDASKAYGPAGNHVLVESLQLQRDILCPPVPCSPRPHKRAKCDKVLARLRPGPLGLGE